MAVLYVAISKGLGKWSADVGLTKHIYRIGLTEGEAQSAIDDMNAQSFARESDWRLAGALAGIAEEEGVVLARIGAKEKTIDVNYYPRLKGTSGLFKIKPANVESHILVRQAMAGEEPRVVKIKNADIVQYLLSVASGAT